MESAKESVASRPYVSAEVRRELLAQAALRVMKRDGIAAATTRAITTEADMPHGAFHYCFRSKRELFAQLLSTDNNPGLDAAWLEGASSGKSALNFRSLFRSYWAHVAADPELQLVLNEISAYALRDAELHDLPRREHRQYIEKIERYLSEFAQRACIAYTLPVASLAEMIVAALGGTMNAWLSHRDSELARATLDQFAEQFQGYAEPLPR